MPPRASHLPSHLERSALQKLLGGRELSALKLHPTGRQTIKKMIAKGWIEVGSSEQVYRIMQAGEDALRIPLPLRKMTNPAIDDA